MLDGFPPLPPEVLLGPAIGEDGCAIAVPAGVLVVATDPITLTGADVGRLSVMVNANDIAVMGVRPRWFLATVLLPPGTTDLAVEELFAAIRAALEEVGATLVGGHTEITAAVTQPVVVGEMLGMAEHGQFLTTGGARPGDVVAQVGPVPIEGPAVLVAEASARLAALDPQTIRAAGHGLVDPGISVVAAALAAAELGATALHDPTEGGLAGGLHELASAARVGVRVDLHRILWFPPGVAVCRALGADPMATLASGALVATFGARPGRYPTPTGDWPRPTRSCVMLSPLVVLCSQLGTCENPSVPQGTAEAEDRHSYFYDARLNLSKSVLPRFQCRPCGPPVRLTARHGQ